MRTLSSRRLIVLCLMSAVPLLLTAIGCGKKTETEPLVPAAPAKAATKAPQGEPIKIGAIFSVTGAGAPLGEPEKQSVEMLAKEVNDAGGISGRPLQVIVEDDATEESKAVLAAKKLIEQDKVCAIVGPTMSGTSLAIIDTCEKAQIPLVSCAASVKITSPVKKWVFSTAQTDVLAVQRIIASCLEPKKVKEVAIICDSNAFGQSGAEQLKAQLPKTGIKIVDEEKFATKDTDMTAQLTKIKAKTPAAVICWGTNPGPAIVAKNVKSLGMKCDVIMSHGIANKKFIELAGDAAEGVVFPAGKLLVVSDLDAKDPQKTALGDYDSKFKAAYPDKAVNTFGGHAYDALQLVVAALKAGKLDAAGIRDAVEATKNYAGIGGLFNMSPTDHNGLTKDAFTFVTIKGGQWTQVK